jgi:phosphate transport system permease protein
MSNVTLPATPSGPAVSVALPQPTNWKAPEMARRIQQRYASERRFRLTGLFALALAGAFLIYLLWTIFAAGLSGFITTEVKLRVTYNADTLYLTPEQLNGPDAKSALEQADYAALVMDSLRQAFPNVEDRDERRALRKLVSSGANQVIRDRLMAEPSLLGKTVDLWVPSSTYVDLLQKNQVRRDIALPGLDEDETRFVIKYMTELEKRGAVKTGFNTTFLTGADSRDPELAAVWGAAKGSFLTLLVTLLISFPIGVMAAVYLEEFAPKNRWTDLIEVNINNLAAVPSIIFGLLGLAVFLGVFGMQRSSPLVGGLTLALLTLPTIVIAARVALKAIPPSIRDAARGLGASPIQVVFHHVLPLAMPGVLTGTIIGMARALGESAPLLMVGMRAFVTEVPAGPLDGGLTQAATVLPVQVFMWSDSVERGFVEKTSAAIIVLLVFLIAMNATAIYLRNKFERRW